MQVKLHQWANSDPLRRFDDLLNLVYGPAAGTTSAHPLAQVNLGVRFYPKPGPHHYKRVVAMRETHRLRPSHVTSQYDTAQAVAAYASASRAPGHSGYFFRSRLQLVQEALASTPRGDLLDAGCGPGIMARTLLEYRPSDFRITVLDQSAAMVQYCIANVKGVGEVSSTVGRLEAMPFVDASFDITLVMGALEYADVHAALREISRVTRVGGLVIVTMLNPLSLYRFTEWFLYWPLLRGIGAIETSIGVPLERRHGARTTGIRAFPSGTLRRFMRQAGLDPIDLIYYDVTPFIPPLDRLPRVTYNSKRVDLERTTTRGWRRWMATAYLITARRT